MDNYRATAMSNKRITDRDWSNRNAAAGLFHNVKDAERAIAELKNNGFTHDQIGVISRERDKRGNLVQEKETHYTADGTKKGAIGGGILGGIIGLLVGIGSAIAVPGVGPVIAGGFLAEILGSTLVGAGIGAVGGGIIGALVDLGIPEEEARYFDSGVREGGILVIVRDADRVEEAIRIMDKFGADIGNDLTATGSKSEIDSRTYYPDKNRENLRQEDLSGERKLELKEERLKTSKENVQTGEVEVHKEVTTENKQVDVPVTREEVIIERHPGSGRTLNSGINTSEMNDETVRIPLREEKVRVSKEPVVSEEVSINKRKVQDTEQINETVRKENARIDSKGNSHVDMRTDVNKRNR